MFNLKLGAPPEYAGIYGLPTSSSWAALPLLLVLLLLANRRRYSRGDDELVKVKATDNAGDHWFTQKDAGKQPLMSSDRQSLPLLVVCYCYSVAGRSKKKKKWWGADEDWRKSKESWWWSDDRTKKRLKKKEKKQTAEGRRRPTKEERNGEANYSLILQLS